MKSTLTVCAFTLFVSTSLATSLAYGQGSGSPGGSGMSDPGAGPGNTQPLGGPGDGSSGKSATEREASRNVTPATMPQHADIPPSAAAPGAKSTTAQNAQQASRNVTPATMPQHSDIPPSAAASSTGTAPKKKHSSTKTTSGTSPSKIPQSSPGG